MLRLDPITADKVDHASAGPPAEAATPEPDATPDAVTAAPERAAAFVLFVSEALTSARDGLDRAGAAGPVRLSSRGFGDGACRLSIRNAPSRRTTSPCRTTC